MKTELTKEIERLLFKRLGHSEIGCGEVTIGWAGNEIVDFITCDVDRNRCINCFEIKVSKADLHSKAKLTFIGNYNYFVIPEELYDEVKTEITSGIGVYIKTKDEFGRDELRCVRRAQYRELKADKTVILSSMLRSMQREWFKALKFDNPKNQRNWIPFTVDEDGVLNCQLPDDEQEVLISNGRFVWIDTFMSDGEEYWLDNVNANLIGLAWQPLPKPHQNRNEQE